MKFFPKPLFLFLLAALLTMLPAGAEEKRIKTSLLAHAPFGLPDDFTAFYQSGEEVRAFSATAASVGLPTTYQGPRRLVFRATKEEFTMPESQRAAQAPVGFVDLPENADMVLIIAAQDPQLKRVRFRAYDLSTANLDPGGYKVFNFSQKNVLLSLGGHQLRLPPGADKGIKGTVLGNTVTAFPLVIATQTDGNLLPAYSSFWEHYPKRRNLFFLFDGKHVSEPVVFSSFDAGEPPKE